MLIASKKLKTTLEEGTAMLIASKKLKTTLEEGTAMLIASKKLKTLSNCRQTSTGKTHFICLSAQDVKKVNHIFEDHESNEMTKDEFRDLQKPAWRKQDRFLITSILVLNNTSVNRSMLSMRLPASLLRRRATAGLRFIDIYQRRLNTVLCESRLLDNKNLLQLS